MACLKKIMLFIFWMGTAKFLAAQSEAIKTMIEQIALLQTYIGYLEKGYDIVGKGLALIGDIKHGDFTLHSDFFNSLETAGPKIKSDARVAAMIAMQIRMVASFPASIKEFKNAAVFGEAELNYIIKVFTKLLDETERAIADLKDIVRNGKLKMAGSERINRLDNLYTQISGLYEFFFSFTSQVRLQVQQRLHERKDLDMLRKIY
jgi:hypothetical protein